MFKDIQLESFTSLIVMEEKYYLILALNDIFY